MAINWIATDKSYRRKGDITLNVDKESRARVSLRNKALEVFPVGTYLAMSEPTADGKIYFKGFLTAEPNTHRVSLSAKNCYSGKMQVKLSKTIAAEILSHFVGVFNLLYDEKENLYYVRRSK